MNHALLRYDPPAILRSCSKPCARSLCNHSGWRSGCNYGNLGDYFAKKAQWMAQQGFAQEALHCMLLITGTVAGDCRQDPAQKVGAALLAQRWLHALHWEGQAVLEAKVALAQSILQVMERLAVDLPVSPS